MSVTTQDLVTFCKKKGFMYPASEIYGGIAGLYDYGHLGTLLKHNFESVWRKYFLGLSDTYFEIEGSNVMHENVFRASGHLENFIDPIIKCSKCDFGDRADHYITKQIKERTEGFTPEQLTALVEKHKLKCPQCTSDFKPVAVLNMMFPLQMGITGGGSKAYLRPETAQTPYVNFKLQHEILRKKMPMGLAVIGKAYRNEISPRNFTLRQREFTQAELQIFFNPDKIGEHPDFVRVKDYKLCTVLEEDRMKKKVIERTATELVKLGLPQFYVYHLVKIQQFYLEVLKVHRAQFRLYQLSDAEKAFYNKYHFDIEVELSEHGFTEVGGLHYRTDHDLVGHQRVSKQSMEVLEEESGKKYIPHVLELSFGVDRNVYLLLDLNYDDDKERGNVVLKLPSKVTPFYCAVFPLVKNKPEIVEVARRVYGELRGAYSCLYDETASIGRRYARADEVGVQYGITIDFDTLQDNCVTVRDRDSTTQERVKIEKLRDYLYSKYINE